SRAVAAPTPPEGEAAAPSGPWVRLVISSLQPVDGHMGVDLRRGERSVAEKFLNASQVGSPFQQVGGSRMAEAVWPQVRGTGDVREQRVHRPAYRARVHPTTAGAEEQRSPAGRP